MKTSHILLKNPIKAIKSPFKDYELPNNSFISKQHITIKKGLIIAMNYNIAKNLNLSTIGEIKKPTEQEVAKEQLVIEKIKRLKAQAKKKASIAVAILTKNSKLLNDNLE
jgi:hypothetical protein